ncbi:MAG: lamin tail domain-containing protein [bacterium]
MKIRLTAGCLYAGFLIIAHVLFLTAGSVCINEIFYNPVESPEHYYEWIEIYNTDAFDVDISSWSFRVGNSTYTFNTSVHPQLILSAESFAVLAASSSSFMAQYPGFNALLVEYNNTVKLSNSGKFIALLDETEDFIDSLSYEPGWNNNVEGKSIERISVDGASDDPLNWQESSDFGGTPGLVNSVIIPDNQYPDDADSGEDQIEISADFSPLVITEISPSQTNGKDWVEIFMLEEADISSYSLFEKETEIKQFPEVYLSQGSYMVIHCNTAGTDETTDINGNGYLDLYTTDTGLTGTDNVISLRNISGTVVDAVIYSNRDFEAFVPTASYDACAAVRIWEPAVTSGEIIDYESASGDWSEGSSNYSIARVRERNGFPNAVHPSSKNYFVLNKYPNPGGGYGHTDGQYTNMVEVMEPNPFSPYDSNPKKQFARINFNLPAGSVKTLYLFDVHGRERIKLISNDNGLHGRSWAGIDAGQVLWDGRDSSGEILPIGIYILYMRAVDPAGGAKYEAKDTVVLGRKL